MNTGAGGECQAIFTQLDMLVLQAFQVHFDTVLRAVVEGQMAHGVGIEPTIQLTVQMMQCIQIEGSSEPSGIIIGGVESF